MDELSLWVLVFSLEGLTVTLILLFVASSNKWSDPPIDDKTILANNTAPNGFKTWARQFIFQWRWEILLAGVMAIVFLYLFVFAPIPMTGELAITPGKPGRPFFFVKWQRIALTKFYDQAGIAVSLLSNLLVLALTIFAYIRRSPRNLRTALLWSSLSLSIIGQWYLPSESYRPLGIVAYIVAFVGFFIWGRLTSGRIHSDLNSSQLISRRVELLLVAGMIMLTSFGRLYELGSIPYGIEGDEAKWTAEIVDIGIRGLPDSTGLYHRDALPTSFFMQLPFHKAFGPSLFAARLEVALYSILATLVFYLLLRSLTSIPLALLASWLLGASAFDISASRLANVESHVKLWPVLTLFLLAWALRTKRWPAFAISGVAMAIGLLTYDTVWPLFLVALIIAVTEINRQPLDKTDKIRFLAALTAPSILVMPFILPYFMSRWGYYKLENTNWQEGLTILGPRFFSVLDSWYIQTRSDFIYNRSGPILNALLLPWLTLGFALALANFRQRFSFWNLVWAMVFIFPVPIIANSALGRVYYPALPAIYALTALGLFIFTKDMIRSVSKIFRPFIFVLAFLGLVWIPIFDFYIYFNEVADFPDRQKRREIGEIVGQIAGSDTLIILPSIPNADEPLNNEWQMIELFMLKKIPHSQISEAYIHVSLDDLLSSLPSELTGQSSVEIILDKTFPEEREKRDELSTALKTCYPKGKLIEGIYIDRFSLNASALNDPACIGAKLNIASHTTHQIDWSLSRGAATGLSLSCEIQKTAYVWIEAETLPPPPGWQNETAFVKGWTGTGFLKDAYNSLPLLHEFESKAGQNTFIWVRFFKRAVDKSPGQIAIDGKTLSFGNATKENINQWIWERVGPFPTSKEMTELSLARPYNEDPSRFMALFIDAIVITSDPAFHPEQDAYQPLPIRHFEFKPPQSSGQITLGLGAGTYRCIAEIESQQPLVDALGHTPVKSNTILIAIP